MSSHARLSHTGRIVVAHGEPRTHIGIDGARWAVLAGAADLLRANPDQLGEVSPRLKVAHVWVVRAVVGLGISFALAVVPHVRDGLSNSIALVLCFHIG